MRQLRLSKEASISSIADLSGRTAVAAAAPRRALSLVPDTAPAAPAPSRLAQVQAAFDVFDGQLESAAALAAASARARSLCEAGGDSEEAETSAALAFAAEALTGVLLQRTWPRDIVAETIAHVALIVDVPRDTVSLELFVRAASSARLLDLPPLLAVELQLRLLLALSPITEVSLWADEIDREARCVSHAGETPPTRSVRALVRPILDGTVHQATTPRNWIHSAPVLRWQPPHAALIGRSAPDDGVRARAFLEEAARCLGPALERNMLLERSADDERALAEASTRQLMRLGFDIHDGPLQDLAVLAMDVQEARGEIAKRLPAGSRTLVSGRLDDIHAQINTLEQSLREVAQSLQPMSVVERPLAEVLRGEVDKLERRGSTRATLELGGDLEGLTASQRITIYRVVQEGLSNVRDHSEATDVRITVDGRRDQIDIEIEDNGKGFHVEPTMVRAAKNGRLGLVGIGERVRLLGGRFDIRSRTGGPTVLSVTLLRWRPPTE
jgi:signal transduction histidine kinase